MRIMRGMNAHTAAPKVEILDLSTPLEGDIHMRGKFIPQDAKSPAITFAVHNHRVNYKGTPMEQLSESDRLAWVNALLGTYRALSSKDCGLFSSALGITDKGNIYIAYNSNEVDQTAKNCAEANLSNIMSLLTKNTEKFTTIYMMAGLNGKHETLEPQQLEDLTLPCGRCADIIGAHTTPEAMIYAVPANNGQTPITLNTTAPNIADVSKGEAWKFSVQDVLLKYSTVALPEGAQQAQKTGWAEMVERKAERATKRQEQEKINVMALMQKALADPDSLTSDESHLFAVIAKAAENAAHERSSIAALDADPSLENINRFMVKQVQLANDHRPMDENRITRCAVIRFADGTFSSATEIIGKEDNATPTAEYAALSVHRITKQPITDVWVIEANKQDIDAGTMHTSSKQSIERAFKRRPQKVTVKDFAGQNITERINLHFIPFNNGKLTSEEVASIMFSPKIDEAYASLYRGSKQMKADGCCLGH